MQMQGFFLRGGEMGVWKALGDGKVEGFGGGRQSRAALPLSKLGNVPAN